MTEKQLWLAAPDTPTCQVTGRPMIRSAGGAGDWVCGVAPPSDDTVSGPFVHGKCWAALVMRRGGPDGR